MTCTNVQWMAASCVQYWNPQPSNTSWLKGRQLPNCQNCVKGPVQIGVPHDESTTLYQENNLSVTPELMDFDDFRQPNTPQNDKNISPTSSILDFSVDYPSLLWPAGLHESLLTDPAKVTVGAHMVTYKIVEDTSI